MKTVFNILLKIAMACLALFGIAIAVLILLPSPAPFTLNSYLNDHGYSDDDDDDFVDDDILI